MTDLSQRQKPGPGKPLTAQRELYFRLMKQGLNDSEAQAHDGPVFEHLLAHLT